MTATDPATWPEHIRVRYGASRRPRWVLPGILIVGVALLGFVTFVGVRLSQVSISAGVATFDVVSDDHLRLTFEVKRAEPVAATCVLRARAQDGFDVAYAVVQLPPASGHTGHTYDLRTAYRAVVGELLGCAVGDEPPPGIQAAQFRPGVVPPEQPWTSPEG